MRRRNLQKLVADPKRQAMPTLEGFSYQVWQSIYHWINLRENQALVLEGAEDLDLIGPGYAEPIQVMHSSASRRVTLQSRKIIDAIAHFWQHQIDNKETVISFRFLTTAERGYERGKPFGKSQGLSYWDSCKFPGTNLQPLRSFLSGKSLLSTDLRAFIASATDEELRSRLIKRIEWDTGSKPQPLIKDAIKRQLASYGNRVYDFPPADSEKVIPHLLARVWDTIIKRDDRSLTHYDFMRLFQEVTSVLIGKSELRSYRRSQQAIHPSHAAQAFIGAVLEDLSELVNDELVKRPELVTELCTRLNNSRLIALSGSSGMGKSILAEEIANASEGEWRRLDMRGRSPERVLERLEYAASVVIDKATDTSCIIDDLNFEARPDLYENALLKLIYAIHLNGGRVIVTTQGMLPSRVASSSDITTELSIAVPPLTEVGIKQLASNYLCPRGNKLEGWSRIIFLKTRGHPQLAHAYVKRLTARQWPSHTFEDLGQTQDLDDVRREVRTRLKEQLPSDEARQLSYRLSVMTGAFQRDHAVYMGQHSPPLRAAGEAFDVLIGPWVERVNEKYFRQSPLLDNSAAENFTKLEIKGLHESAAKAFLSSKAISPTELSAVLFHGMLGDSKATLATAVAATFQIPKEHWPDLSRTLDWFGFCSLRNGERLFPSDQLINFLLRRLQFKVVAETNAERAIEIVSVTEKELEHWDGDGQARGQAAMQFAHLLEVILELQVPFPIATAVRHTGRLIELLQTDDLHRLLDKGAQEITDETLQELASPAVLVRALVGRCKVASNVMEFLSAVEDQPADVAEKVWDVLGDDDDSATRLADRIWLDEAKSTAPDWNQCLQVLDEIAAGAIAKQKGSLIAAAYRAKAIVQEEYLKDLAAALRTLDEGETALGSKDTVLEDYRARALFLEEQYPQAIEIWNQILPTMKDKEVSLFVTSFRDAEICEAKLGNWKRAGELALAGESATRKISQYFPESAQLSPLNDLTVGYRADYAFALWKCGERAAAIKEFTWVLGEFDILPDPTLNVRINMLYQRVGHAVTWLNAVSRGIDEFVEPPAGFFSNQEIVDQIKEREVYPRVILWYLLAKLEHRFNWAAKSSGGFSTNYSRVAKQSQKAVSRICTWASKNCS
jgi:tetratricopeptide (TPR) repeat protein